MTKNLFLYISYIDNLASCSPSDNIYYFKNRKIVALDRIAISKGYRLELQQKLSIRPYYISQNVFKETLLYMVEYPGEILLMDIVFFDEDIEESSEYNILQKLMLENNTEAAYKLILKVLELYDTEINKMRIRYKGYDVTITSEGVLDVEAPEEILVEFISDRVVNKLMLGLGYNFSEVIG